MLRIRLLRSMLSSDVAPRQSPSTMRGSSQSSRTILIDELYPAVYASACPDLNSRTKAPQRTLLQQFFVSSQACCTGRPVIEPFRKDCPGLSARTRRMPSVCTHTMMTRSDQTIVQDLQETA